MKQGCKLAAETACRIGLLLCAVALLGLTKWGFSYIAFMGQEELVGFYSVPLSARLPGVIALVVGSVLLVAAASRLRWLSQWLTGIGLAVVAAQGLFWLLCTQPTPFADSLSCLQAAQNALQNNWTDFVQGGYLYRYPFQSGIVALDEAALRIAGSWEGGLNLLRGINFVALMGITISLCAIARRLFGEKVQMLSAVLLACSVPVARYVFFLYGNLICSALGFAGVWLALRYLDSHRRRWAVGCAVCLALAMAAKSTALIFVVAVVIVLVLCSVQQSRWQPILAAVLILALAWLPGKAAQMMYSLRSGVPMQPGTATVTWLAMGLDPNPEQYEFAPGWHTADKRSEKAYENAGFDYQKMKQQQTEALRQNLQYWGQNPSQFKTFLRAKTVSQWLDPGFGSWLYLERNTDPVSAQNYQQTLYQQGWNEGLNPFLGCVQTAVYLAGLIGTVWLLGKGQPRDMLPALVFFGGVFYLTLSEGKSQYAILFYPMLLPVAALGMETVQKGLARLRNRQKKCTAK